VSKGYHVTHGPKFRTPRPTTGSHFQDETLIPYINVVRGKLSKNEISTQLISRALSLLQISAVAEKLGDALFLSRRSRQRKRPSASVLSICSSVCLSVAKMQKRDFLKN